MPQATSLSVFADLMTAGRSAPMGSVTELSSQASKYRVQLFQTMLKGLTTKKLISAGTDIVDYIQLKFTPTYAYYNASDTSTYTGDDTLTAIRVPWRFWKVYSVTTEHELKLSGNDPVTTLKRVKDAKMSAMELDFFQGMEESLWATPNLDTMESATSSLSGSIKGEPYSLRCFITDDGGAPTSANGGVAGTGGDWSTVMTVNPTTFSNWKNQVSTYTNTNNASRRDDETGVINAMNEMWLKCHFESPTDSQQYVKDTQDNKLRIVGNLMSNKLLVSVASSKNNVLTPKSEVGEHMGKVTYRGIPLTYISRLDYIDNDDAAPDTNPFTATDGTGKLGYRFRFINFNHIRPIFHTDYYRNRRNLDGGASDPLKAVIREDTWGNLWCANRREQGIVRAA